jgi:hypothetical protein
MLLTALPVLAIDRAIDNRSIDADGRLHVQTSNISKAAVNEYYGQEIPGWQELGLEPDRLYSLLRDPDELARGVATFNNLPVLSEHVPVTADDHQPELVVGSTGTDAAFDGTFMTNSLVVWARDSIDGIVNDDKRQLSSAYRYRADMTPGEFQGLRYDGVMRDIVGNHVALVFVGRAGPDVIVGDEKPMSKMSRYALMLSGSLAGLVRPRLAQDAKLDLSSVLADIKVGSLKDAAPREKLATQVVAIASPLLAQDAQLDIKDVRFALDAVADMDDDPAMDEDDEKEPKGAEDEEKDDKPAMDAAAVQVLVDKSRTDALAEVTAIRTAEREVFPVVGELVAMDSAAAVYRTALDQMGVDLKDVPDSALGSLFRATKKAVDAASATGIAQDAKPTDRSSFDARFPNRVKLVRG